jgi:CRP/FNR family transcriptional regulator, cyclic AMP receptor protein
MPNEKNAPVDWETLFAGLSHGKTVAEYSADQRIFQQGHPADSIFYVRTGTVELSFVSLQGVEAIAATIGAGEFLGEGCISSQPVRMSTARAVTDCSLIRLEKALMMRLLHENHEISELFLTHLLSRNVRYEAEIVGHLFDSTERRLARILLLLAHFGKEGRSEPVLSVVSRDSLAQIIGTPLSEVSHFMNKFRKLGFIDYSDHDQLMVHSGLLSVVLHDKIAPINGNGGRYPISDFLPPAIVSG